jgi:hypothetical protein
VNPCDIDLIGVMAMAYLSPLRQLTFFHSGLCRWKAKLVGFSVDCSPSAPLRQNEGLHEGRISGSS